LTVGRDPEKGQRQCSGIATSWQVPPRNRQDRLLAGALSPLITALDAVRSICECAHSGLARPAKGPPRRVEHGPRRVGLGVEAGGRTGPRTRQEEVAR
jgi:hypothetical protein